MIRQFGGKHIVNLGHGVYPDTPLDGVRAFIGAVKS
ncbi:MAG: uroporphyrinogen decarboxylase family protein [Bacteroidota bacterium]